MEFSILGLDTPLVVLKVNQEKKVTISTYTLNVLRIGTGKPEEL